MSSELEKKEEQIECNICSFIRGDKKDYSKHLMTAKSIKMVYTSDSNGVSNEVLNKRPNAIKHVCYCGKEYIYSIDLLYRGVEENADEAKRVEVF